MARQNYKEYQREYQARKRKNLPKTERELENEKVVKLIRLMNELRDIVQIRFDGPEGVIALDRYDKVYDDLNDNFNEDPPV